MLASFKKKFLKTSLIYYIYRYFKYKFKSFSSYGGSGEDIFITKFFHDLKKGFYVDVGALHQLMVLLLTCFTKKDGTELILI